MKPARRGMVWTGWVMTIGGLGVVLFWTVWEAANNFQSAPLQTVIGLIVILAVLALLVPVPLIVATRRARATTAARAQRQ